MIERVWREIHLAGEHFLTFFRDVYSYRGYIVQSVTRDLRKKYKRSSLGYLWSMLNPLLMITVLTVIFSNLLPRVEHYAVFLFSALISWQYFSGTVSECMSSIRGNMNLIQQVPMPKFIFPITIACSNFVNLLLTLVALLIVTVVVGRPLHWTVLLFPIYFIPLLLITLGLGLLLAVSEIFFEDTKHLTKLVLQAWYYLTPVLYGPAMLPEHVVRWLRLNPLFYPVTQLREIFYDGAVPALLPYLLSVGVGVVVLAVALRVFYRNEDKFIYFV
ncbi:ABC transporter permease [bacterium]|nr:ABC transporter permease [bacterium]